jgi:hypothetical protein
MTVRLFKHWSQHMPGKAPFTHLIAALVSASLVTAPLAVAADPIPADAQWGTPSAVLVTGKGRIRLGDARSPYCIAGNDVINVKTGRITGVTLADMPNDTYLHAFSPDGKYFAAAFGRSVYSSDLPTPTVHVWDLQTGKICCSIKGNVNAGFEFIAFTKSKTLVTGERNATEKAGLNVWDPQNGELIKTIPTGRFSAPLTTISPSGRYLATMNSGIKVYDLQTNREILQIDVADFEDDKTRTYFTDIEFSPDGKELAAFSDTNYKKHIFVWNTAGKLVEDISFRSSSDWNRGTTNLLWAPDAQAWLLNNERLVDRTSKRHVANIKFPFGSRPQVLFNEKSRLLAVTDETARSTREIIIPWDTIRRSIQAMQDPSVPAALRPNQPVSVEFQLDLAMGGKEPVIKSLTSALESLLQSKDITIAKGQATNITIKLERDPKRPDPIPRSTTTPEHRGSPEKTVKWNSFERNLTLEITNRSKPQPILTQTSHVESSNVNEKDLSDARMHETMVRGAVTSVSFFELPYYYPLTPGISPLPATVEVARDMSR